MNTLGVLMGSQIQADLQTEMAPQAVARQLL